MGSTIPLSQLGGRSATFEQPFEMMEACHERVERTLGLLQRLREHLPEHGADEQAQQAARDIMKYFDQAAPQHHRDEELHVFPPLMAHGDDATLATVSRLQQDHLQMDARWRAARPVLEGIAKGELGSLSQDQGAALDAFACLYADHIVAEEQVAYPAAQKLLDDAAVQAMGAEMKKRRGG